MTPVYQRFALLILCFSSVYSDNVIPQNPLESQVLLLLKKWRIGEVNYGIIPLPSLRSVKIPDVDYYYDRKGIKMTYNLQKMALTGLDSFLINELKALETKNTLEMSISLNIPKLNLFAENYELKGRAYLMYPLKGSGNMTAMFSNNDLTFKIHFMTAGNEVGTRIEDFKFDYNVHKLEVNLTDSSWPINKVLNSEGLEILASYHDFVVEAMWAYVVPYVDNHLVNVTISQIVSSLLNTKI